MSAVGCSHLGHGQVRSKEGLLLASALPRDKEDLEASEVDGGTEDQESSAEESGKRARKTKKKYNRHPKPPYTYLAMIALVIQASPDRKLKLSQIIQEISSLFPFFQEGYQGWKDSIRHNLSSNSCFHKVLKDPTKPKAKGNFWTVDVERIPAEALRLQNTPVSRQEERMFAVDLAPYVLHGWPFHSSPAPQGPSASERRATCLSESGAQQHSPFSIDSLLSDFQDVGLSGKPKVGAEPLPPRPATSLDFWGQVPIFCVSSGPPILPYRPPCPLPALQPFSSGSSSSGLGSALSNEGEAGGQALMESQLAKRPRVLQASSCSGSALEGMPPPQLPTSYTKCVAPNVVAPSSHSPPFSALPVVPGMSFYEGPTSCISPVYWEVKARHSLEPLPPPRLPADLDQTVPPNKTVFDIWMTHPADIVQPFVGRASAFPRSALLGSHLDHL